MSDAQMDLLSWTPPVKVIAFPLAARIDKVRRCAEVLERKNGKDAKSYWTRTVRSMADRLLKAGIDRRLVEIEADRFTEAVERELQRRAWAGQSKQPDGAA